MLDVHPKTEYQERALGKLVRNRRSIMQSYYGVGTRDVQYMFAKHLLDEKYVDRAVVVAPKTLFGVWERYIEGSEKFLLVSNVSIRMHAYKRDDFSRDVVIIDIGVSGRHTSAVVNHLFSELPVWLAARWPVLPGIAAPIINEDDPIHIAPAPIGTRRVLPQTWK